MSRSGVRIKGKRAVVVGRSNIVGLPVSLLLLKADATVTIAHSHTSQPEDIIREADIVIAAAGQAKMVTSRTYLTLSAHLFQVYVLFFKKLSVCTVFVNFQIWMVLSLSKMSRINKVFKW